MPVRLPRIPTKKIRPQGKHRSMPTSSKRKKVGETRHSAASRKGKFLHRPSTFPSLLSIFGVPLLLAAVTFLVYWQSLNSDFVYDARHEILEEGFITSISNLPSVLSLKVLGMNLFLGTRPGQLLYLMLIASICGKEPFGYHLCSNLLHAANVALLFVLLRRLIEKEMPELNERGRLKAQCAAVVVTLAFALHPIAVESVSEVSYSSSLLVAFFTLLALLAATAFRPENTRFALLWGGWGSLCALAAVCCKESGIAAALLLVVYWFLYRRHEAKGPWVLFMSVASAMTATFLAARFLLAPPSPMPLGYLGGSFPHVFLIQPTVWVFMMGQLIWPTHLSADYTLHQAGMPSIWLALVILTAVLMLQIWLITRSQLGALGVAIYWSGLLVVSNFVPLLRFTADRFYYLPLAGVIMQLLSLLIMTLEQERGFWIAVTLLIIALVPFTALTLTRESVFASDSVLWPETLKVSPDSSTANYNVGWDLFQKGDVDGAISYYQKALKTAPNDTEAHSNFGLALLQKGQLADAITQFQDALNSAPNNFIARNNMAVALFQQGQTDEAITQLEKCVKLNPNYAESYYNLGKIFSKSDRMEDAISEYQKALQIDPAHASAHNNLGIIFAHEGKLNAAIVEFQDAIQAQPDFTEAQNNLITAQGMLRQAK